MEEIKEQELTVETEPAPEATRPERKKMSKRDMVLAVLLVVAVVVAVLVGKWLWENHTPAYAAPLDTMIAVTFEGEVDRIEDMAPQTYWAHLAKEGDEYTMDAIKGRYTENWQETMAELEALYGKNIDVSYEILEKTAYPADKLEQIATSLDTQYGIAAATVTEGYELIIDMTIKGDTEESNDSSAMTMVKIDGAWYAVNVRMNEDKIEAYFGY